MSAVLDLDQIACSGNGVVSETGGQSSSSSSEGHRFILSWRWEEVQRGCCCVLQQLLEDFSPLASTWSFFNCREPPERPSVCRLCASLACPGIDCVVIVCMEPKTRLTCLSACGHWCVFVRQICVSSMSFVSFCIARSLSFSLSLSLRCTIAVSKTHAETLSSPL